MKVWILEEIRGWGEEYAVVGIFSSESLVRKRLRQLWKRDQRICANKQSFEKWLDLSDWPLYRWNEWEVVEEL